MPSEYLLALHGDQEMGRLHYKNDTMRFDYSPSWSASHSAFPLSLSMPLTASTYPDKVVRPFITGLLPDNDSVLTAWGKRFHVSPRNPFRILKHVGEECAGAIQFCLPDKRPQTDQGTQITWLSDSQLIERIDSLVSDHSNARRVGDLGQFSLAGAQPKTGLYLDESTNKWGIPHGTTPTTHILKPHVGNFKEYHLNEHFCLRLAENLGLSVAKSTLQTIGKTPVIIVKRFDRIRHQGKIIRVHQEDTCQALSVSPNTKYESEGGPSAKNIFNLIRDFSNRPQEDTIRFLDALLLNWIIGGTDAHSKNYGFLIAEGGQVRLTPFYDISSSLPYHREIPIQKARLAMKIGNSYKLAQIKTSHWEKSTFTWKIPITQIQAQYHSLIQRMPEAVSITQNQLLNELDHPHSSNHSFLQSMSQAILSRNHSLQK